MMELLMLTYGGPDLAGLERELTAHCVHGYTVFAAGRGVGVSGKREGSRAWPGETVTIFAILEPEAASWAARALQNRKAQLPPDERLHVAVLPVQNFF